MDVQARLEELRRRVDEMNTLLKSLGDAGAQVLIDVDYLQHIGSLKPAIPQLYYRADLAAKGIGMRPKEQDEPIALG